VPAGFRYSRWDGSQTGFDIDADGILSQLTDDLIYHGDLNAALRRLLQDGATGPDGERITGLRELLERLRRRRQEELEANDLGGASRRSPGSCARSWPRSRRRSTGPRATLVVATTNADGRS